MLEETTPMPQRARTWLRSRIVLRVVEPGDAMGFVIPHQAGSAAFRGSGGADYACGGCGRLLAIGVRPGMFQSFVFACACGSLNQVG